MRAVLIAAVALASLGALRAGQWSAEAKAVDREGTALVKCRARLAGEYLLVELRAADGWHVYAMDNEQRAKKALAGRMSLGVEQNTEVHVGGGLEVAGDWFQTEPKDFSQPALRWYSFGFEGTSLLAAPVRRQAGDSATVSVTAQACDSASCISVEAEMVVSLEGDDGDQFEPVGLVAVGGGLQ